MIGTKSRLKALLPKFESLRVAVIGDLVADCYVLTEPARLSREAPVMIARWQRDEMIPGGAANAANNLLALGASVRPIGLLGEDPEGRSLRSWFESNGVECGGIVVVPAYRTITKTRIMCGDPGRMKQQVLRIDREPDRPPMASSRTALKAAANEALSRVDAVMFSDYGYDLIDADLVASVLSHSRGRVVTADSRYAIASFRGVTLSTPNEGEAEEAAGLRIRTTEDLERAGRILLERTEAPALMITRGNRGLALFPKGEPRLDIPAMGSGQVVDVSGAGDTVIAVATLALAAGASFADAALLANIAAGVVVMKLGAATCSIPELLEAVEAHA